MVTKAVEKQGLTWLSGNNLALLRPTSSTCTPRQFMGLLVTRVTVPVTSSPGKNTGLSRMTEKSSTGSRGLQRFASDFVLAPELKAILSEIVLPGGFSLAAVCGRAGCLVDCNERCVVIGRAYEYVLLC